MDAQILHSSSDEISISLKKSDIATLYIVQHELLKGSGVDFAGVIVKHPLTNECWMRVNSGKNDPMKEISKATSSAIDFVENLKKIFDSKLKVK